MATEDGSPRFTSPAHEHPVPEDYEDEQRDEQAQRPRRRERNDGDDRSSNRSQDPWARRDTWQEPPSTTSNLESEFAQFQAWKRQQQGAGASWGTYQGRGGGNGGWWGSGWYGPAAEEQERTTAGPPPEWDGESVEFKDWKLKAKIWLRTTRTPPTARGPLLLKNLTKGPWQDLKHLASDDAWLGDPDNGLKLVQLMDSKDYYGEELRESLLAACSRLTYHLRREKGDTARSFLTKWENSERKLRDHGVVLPEDYLGFLLVNALQLDSERIKLFMNYSKGSLKVADVKAWLRIHETELDMSVLGNDKKKSKHTYLMETEIQHLEPEEDYQTEDEPVEMLLTALQNFEENDAEENPVELTESEAQELLMTMVKEHKGGGKGGKSKTRTFAGAAKAKKNRDLARGYGAGP